jgi:quercetin dioxygenase-like cupin family protein
MNIVHLDKDKLQPISHGSGLKYIFEQNGFDAKYLTQAAYGIFRKHDLCSEHKHSSMIELFFFIKGTGTYTIEGKDFDITNGTFLRIDPGEIHELKISTDSLEFFYIGIPTNDD